MEEKLEYGIERSRIEESRKGYFILYMPFQKVEYQSCSDYFTSSSLKSARSI
jgi:hypothetical protein